MLKPGEKPGEISPPRFVLRAEDESHFRALQYLASEKTGHAHFESPCASCGGEIRREDEIRFHPAVAHSARHAGCPAVATEASAALAAFQEWRRGKDKPS